MQTRGFPLKDEDGQVTSIAFTSEDISERKQAEQEILEYQQRLKSLAAELTLTEERERRRIAAELHDHVGQSLALARIQLATARKVESEARRNSLLDDTSQNLLETIQTTRSLVFDLSSPLLNEIGLEAAISEWVEQNVREPYALNVDVIDDGRDKPLSEDVRAIMYRNVRELLNNVVKHADATSIRISTERVDDTIKVSVVDDGCGMDSQEAIQRLRLEGGFGLFSIQERMSDLGGSLQIVSSPGQGCTAILIAPLEINPI